MTDRPRAACSCLIFVRLVGWPMLLARSTAARRPLLGSKTLQTWSELHFLSGCLTSLSRPAEDGPTRRSWPSSRGWLLDIAI
jgi:hypothetical protein